MTCQRINLYGQELQACVWAFYLPGATGTPRSEQTSSAMAKLRVHSGESGFPMNRKSSR